ncbi:MULTISPECIES: helix-turn-helix transcriptional regulator [unclassified Saccharothrix]|uniref:helix-turn-helix transcriptional regulator n=1 Tax=unclassified Saccharothrix TaxID=2593673 RepID=UPI00307F345F
MILGAAEVANWSKAETVTEICRQCEVSPLRAHRLAHGWTLAEVAARVRAHAAANGLPTPHVSHPNVSRWETGTEKPSARNLDALCQVYRARPDILGFGADYTDEQLDGGRRRGAPPAGHSSDTGDVTEDRMRRRDVLRGLLSTAGVGFGGAALDAIEGTRQALMNALQSRSVEPGTVDWWEEQADHHAGAYRTMPAPRLLAEVTLDFDDLQQLLAQRQPLDSQQRLTAVTARMAGLVGILCVDVGAVREARRWFHTGQIAAEEVDDRPLRAWLYTREALASLYYGSATEAASLARTARRLAGGTTLSTASAMAPAVEARALASMGRGAEALAAMRHSELVFEKLPESVTRGGVFGFTEPKLRFYQGNVLARAAGMNRALTVHDQALRLYPEHDRVDRGHIRLDQALTLLRHGELDEACRRIGQTFLGFTGDEGIKPVAAQALEIHRTINERHRRHAAVRQLDEILALPHREN